MQIAVSEDLLSKVLEPANIHRSINRVTHNNGSQGIDGMKVQELRLHWQLNGDSITKRLLDGTYEPKPLLRVNIRKHDGKLRPLGVPSVLDRVIQQALHQVITPIFDPIFSQFSYGYRPGRNAHQAVLQAKEYIQAGYRYVVDIDLMSFFDTIDHHLIMDSLRERISDYRVLELIQSYLVSGVMDKGRFTKITRGVSQGGPLSPLLANIILDKLDYMLDQYGLRYVRYADDCNIYVNTEHDGHQIMQLIENFLKSHLNLLINKEKSSVDRPWKRSFLGLTFTENEEPGIRIAPQSINNLKVKIRQLTNMNCKISMERRIKDLNAYLRGWYEYYRVAEDQTIYHQLDEWICRRLIICQVSQGELSASRSKLSDNSDIWSTANGLLNRYGSHYWNQRGFILLNSREADAAHLILK